MDFCGLILKLQKIRKGEVVTLGHSCLGRDIYGVFYNFKSDQNLLVSGAIHAREHITSDLIMWLIDCLETVIQRRGLTCLTSCLFRALTQMGWSL